ncbi:homer protein 2 [Biomphalaria pfeifferi]|uniref:Homer protein 2 n=1 Tax=Biomphalaria pfeifferi TaxID=112525 RepID=A0AAD8BSZ0_BIOPF|nr:homer protein 2 [Biomphalaria pfeifferi]
MTMETWSIGTNDKASLHLGIQDYEGRQGDRFISSRSALGTMASLRNSVFDHVTHEPFLHPMFPYQPINVLCMDSYIQKLP